MRFVKTLTGLGKKGHSGSTAPATFLKRTYGKNLEGQDKEGEIIEAVRLWPHMLSTAGGYLGQAGLNLNILQATKRIGLLCS